VKYGFNKPWELAVSKIQSMRTATIANSLRGAGTGLAALFVFFTLQKSVTGLGCDEKSFPVHEERLATTVNISYTRECLRILI
jgi:hypothetical protein